MGCVFVGGWGEEGREVKKNEKREHFLNGQ